MLTTPRNKLDSSETPRIRTASKPDQRVGNFEDAKRAAYNYDFNFELSKSFLAVCACFCCALSLLSVFLILGWGFPQHSTFIERYLDILPGAMKPANINFQNLKFRPKPSRTRPTTSTTTTTTTAKPTTTTTTTTTTETPITRKRNPIKSLYKAGVGIAEITGPAAGYGMMGHNNPYQINSGIHTRQYSRAFCFSQKKKKFVYVAVELYAVGWNVRNRVIHALEKANIKDLDMTNLHMVGTGTCATPGCHMAEYFLGVGPVYDEQCVKLYVDGIKKSIQIACKALENVHLFMMETDIYYSASQRSPSAYNSNPKQERESYNHDYDIVLKQLRIENEFFDTIGIINWVPVRACSYGPTNALVSSDVLGYASLKIEQIINDVNHTLAGKAKNIVAFVPTNTGDISPHYLGGVCVGGKYLNCLTRLTCKDYNFWGSMIALYQCKPYFDPKVHYDQVKQVTLVGSRVFEAAKDAIDATGTELRGNFEVTTTTLQKAMTNCTEYDTATNEFKENAKVEFCSTPFIGDHHITQLTFDSDLPRDMDYVQGELKEKLASLGETPSDTRYCQYPKNFIHSSGTGIRRNHPADWTVSMINLGGLLIALVPGDVSTMAGRRMKKIVDTAMTNKGIEPNSVISSHANEHILYITTYEEYQHQYYEAAAVVGGSHTAYTIYCMIRDTAEIVLKKSDSIHHVGSLKGESDYHKSTKNVQKSTLVNITPRHKKFAEIVTQPTRYPKRGSIVSMEVIASNPRVVIRNDGVGYWAVEKLDGDIWEMVASDAEWETIFNWNKESMIGTLTWEIPENQSFGIHRMRYIATSNNKDIEGNSDAFTVK